MIDTATMYGYLPGKTYSGCEILGNIIFSDCVELDDLHVGSGK